METGKMKLALSAGALALSMALAGCGGSSSSGPVAASGGGTVVSQEEEPSAYEKARTGITEAESVEAVLDARDGADVTTDEAETLRGLASARIVALVTEQIADAASGVDAQGLLTEEVKDEVSGTQAEMLEMAIEDRITELADMAEVDRQKMALMTAADDVDAVDIDALSDQPAIDAAKNAITGLQNALNDADDVDDADKTGYQQKLEGLQQAVNDAENILNRANLLATAISSVNNVKTAFEGLPEDETPTEAEEKVVSDAIAKAKTDLAAAKGAGADTADAQSTLDNYEGQFTERQSVIAEERKEAREIAAKARTNKAKALRTALASGNVLDRPAPRSADPNGTVFVSDAGTDRFITIQVDSDVRASDVTIHLTEKTAADSLGKWKGSHYRGMQGTGDSAQAGMQRVYSDRDDPEMVDFADASAAAAREGLAATPESSGDLEGAFEIQNASDATVYSRHIESAGFSDSGTTTHSATDGTRTLSGTYKEAAGNFICTGTTCTSRYDDDTGSVILGGDWYFAPASSAKLPVEQDNSYLQFGWWKLENSKDEATNIRVFADAEGYGTHINVRQGGDGINVTGSATYNGKAAGLYAVSGDLRQTITDGSGSFTADATLNAVFDGNDSALSGTIDKFTLEDGSDPKWSIALQTLQVSDGIDDGTGTDTDISGSIGWFDSRGPGVDTEGDAYDSATLWSIDGVADQDNTGGWHARMYDTRGHNLELIGPFSGSD